MEDRLAGTEAAHSCSQSFELVTRYVNAIFRRRISLLFPTCIKMQPAPKLRIHSKGLFQSRDKAMAEPNTSLPLTASHVDQIFPTLTAAQIRRIATHGRARSVRPGEVLVEQGTKTYLSSL